MIMINILILRVLSWRRSSAVKWSFQQGCSQCLQMYLLGWARQLHEVLKPLLSPSLRPLFHFIFPFRGQTKFSQSTLDITATRIPHTRRDFPIPSCISHLPPVVRLPLSTHISLPQIHLQLLLPIHYSIKNPINIIFRFFYDFSLQLKKQVPGTWYL